MSEDSESLGLQLGQDRARQSRDKGDLTADRRGPKEAANAVDIRRHSRPQRGQGDPAGDDE